MNNRIYIDIGNTSVDISEIEDDKKRTFKLLNNDKFFMKKFKKIGFTSDSIFYISSVNFSKQYEIVNFLKLTNYNYHLLDTTMMKKYLKSSSIKIDNIDILGQDLFLDLIASKPNSIIVDLGTLSKILYLDKDNYFVGGTILPGIYSSMRMMSEKTDLINDVVLNDKRDLNLLSKDTNDAISSGILHGTVFSILKFVEKIRNKYSKDAEVILTGGCSYLILRMLIDEGLTNFSCIKNLPLVGLSLVYKTNDEELLFEKM